MATGAWGEGGGQRVFRATISFTHGGQRCQTGFHLRDVGINTLDPDDVATEVGQWATTQFIKTLNAQDQVLGVDVENLVSREGHSLSYNNVAGAVGGAQIPAFLMFSVALKGSIRRRYGSGRMLWPVSNINDLNGQVLATAAVTRIAEAITDLQTRFIGPAITTSMHLVHLHEALPAGTNRPAVPATWYDITSIRLNTALSALRRRRQGVGN